MYSSIKRIKTDRFLKLLDQVACPLPSGRYAKQWNPVLGGVYMESLKPDQAGDDRVLLCATDGHIICVRKLFRTDVMQAITVAGFHVVKAQVGELIYSHKKYLALDESDKKDGALLYPLWRRVLEGLKPLPAIPSSNAPELRRYNLFDGDKLALCKSLMDGRVWIPNYAAPYPRGLWAYVDDEFLLGCMPINTYEGVSVETRDYAALFPELRL